MIRYYFNSNTTEIVLTNDIDINLVQNRNPNTQQYFNTQDEAIAWANDFVKEMNATTGLNETLVASPTKVEQPSEIDLLKQEQDKLTQRLDITDSTVNTIITEVIPSLLT
jgi:cell shape-determining protein MreC